MNLSLEGQLNERHYLELIEKLRDGLKQFRSMRRGEHQHCCGVCGDNGHTAEQCWFHNPLHLSLMGFEALTGPIWKCFHCGAIYTSEETAAEHFGKTPDSPAECLRMLAELAEEDQIA